MPFPVEIQTPIVFVLNTAQDTTNGIGMNCISIMDNSEQIKLFSDHLLLTPNKFESLNKEIDNFTNLGINWDGYGAIPVMPTIAESSKQLLSILASSFVSGITDIFPNPHGTITIEWQNRNKEKLSLEIGNQNYSYFIKFNDKQPQLVDGENILSDSKSFTTALEDLFGEEIQKYLL